MEHNSFDKDTNETNMTDQNEVNSQETREAEATTHEPTKSEAKAPKKESFVKRMFPGFVGGVAGALLVGTIGLPFMKEGTSVQNTSLNSDGMPKQTSADVSTDAITNAVATAQPAVVTVNNFAGSMFSDDMTASGVGSGVIYKKDGEKAYIVTNHHVVDGAQKVTVTYNDGETAEAKLLGSDATYDLAVLEVDAANVPAVIPIGKSGDLQPGQTVMALGNPLGQFENSVTRGVVSSSSRLVPVDTDGNGQIDFNAEVIQTDAAINPGNSGGALINEQGQLVGINSMKIATAEVEGVGFSIPVDIALPLINEIEQTGEVNHPSLGVSLREVSEFPEGYLNEQINLPKDVTSGAIIIEVEANSAAAKAGLEPKDVITKINGKDVTSFVELRSELIRSKGEAVDVTYVRDGKVDTVKVDVSNPNNNNL